MHRFFVSPNCISGQVATLEGDMAHQLNHVLRSKIGDELILLDNHGLKYHGQIESIERQRVVVTLHSTEPAGGEARLNITLFQGFPKKDRFEYVLQKGTEIGIKRFVPMITSRTIAKDTDSTHKYERWIRIMQSAAEQAFRGNIPSLSPPLSFEEAIAQANTFDLALMPWEAEKGRRLGAALSQSSPTSAAIYIGPEGGISETEAAQAIEAGIIPITLGARILRTETAGLVTAALLLYEMGEI